MDPKPFTPAWGSSTVVSNATSATAAVALPKSCEQVVLTNTSATAITYVLVTNYYTDGTTPTGDTPTATNGFPILPSSQIRLTVGFGNKLIRTIASAADGNIIISPGNGL